MLLSSLQLGTGILLEPIMKNFNIGTFAASLLNGSYYYTYILFQVPAGLLMDRIGPRKILSICALICSLGCLVFSLTNTYSVAILARLAIGTAASTSFVGVLSIIRNRFPPQYKSILVPITEVMMMIGTIRGVFLITTLLQYFEWNVVIQTYALYFIVVSIGCAIFLKYPASIKSDNTEIAIEVTFLNSLKIVLKDKYAWLNSIYVGLMCSVLSVFISLWATLFLSIHLHISSAASSKISSLTFFGVCIGCPLFGWLSQYFQTRRRLLIISSFTSALLLCFIIYWPTPSIESERIAFFLLGIMCSGFVLSFLISDDISPSAIKNTYMGFTNAGSIFIAILIQPLIGALLEIQTNNQEIIRHLHFQKTLSLIIIALFIATLIAWLMPETFKEKKLKQTNAGI